MGAQATESARTQASGASDHGRGRSGSNPSRSTKGEIVMRTSKKPTKAAKPAKRPYVIVRCYGAGVHAGELVSIKGEHVKLVNSRRIWRWEGAASLSELAVYGSTKPSACKIAVQLDRVDLLDAKEVDYCRPEGEKFLREVAPWRA
jgi:hypothetical protein